MPFGSVRLARAIASLSFGVPAWSTTFASKLMNTSCAGWMRSLTTCSGFSAPGSATTIWSSPWVWISGSATPNESTRLRMISTDRSMASGVTWASSVASPCRITSTPPWRSSPSTAGRSAMATAEAATRPITTAMRRRGRLTGVGLS